MVDWKEAAGDEIYSSPAVANGVVYVGSWDNNLYALNANNGTLAWKYTTRLEWGAIRVYGARSDSEDARIAVAPLHERAVPRAASGSQK